MPRYCLGLKIAMLALVVWSSAYASESYKEQEEAPFKLALSSFKGLRETHPQLKNLKPNHPTCFISYAWGVPEQEKTVHTLAYNLREAGINVLLDIWHNTGGTSTLLFAQKILDPQTDFVVLCGSKKLMEKLDENNPNNSVVRVEVLDLLAQRMTWARERRNILPILLEGRHEEVLPLFLGNTVSIGFQDSKNYPLSCFNLLGRLYKLDSQDIHLQKIIEGFKMNREGRTNLSVLLNRISIQPSIPLEDPYKQMSTNLQKPLNQDELEGSYALGEGYAKRGNNTYYNAASSNHVPSREKWQNILNIFADAHSNPGAMYANGTGVTKEDREAVFWYRKAADQGLAAAQYNLGVMYRNGRGVTKDNCEAFFWFRKAADQGDVFAQHNLGLMYQDGAGVTKDDCEAAFWYRKAANQGNAFAQCNLGAMYQNGTGVTKDDREAVFWYRKAADQGLAAAQYALGWRYANGRGVTKDNCEAVFWYRKAADQGDANARQALLNLGVKYY